jgi:peptide/nickel transport system permease protein
MTTTATAAAGWGQRASFWSRFSRQTGAMLGLAIVLVIVIVAALAPLLLPHDPNSLDLTRRLKDPAWTGTGTREFLLGTDAVGRDYLTRLLHGARTSLVIAVSVVVITALIGCTLGMVGGYFGGRIDAVISYVIACRLAMPGALLILTSVAILGPSTLTLITVMGLIAWPHFAVVTRAASMQVRSLDFIPAAVASGSTPLTILLREILPNIAPSIIVIATIELAQIILAEAALSFLGLGVQPPTPAWGLMASEGKQFMYSKPWLVTLPGLCILLLVIGLNLLGNGVRAATAPPGRS